MQHKYIISTATNDKVKSVPNTSQFPFMHLLISLSLVPSCHLRMSCTLLVAFITRCTFSLSPSSFPIWISSYCIILYFIPFSLLHHFISYGSIPLLLLHWLLDLPSCVRFPHIYDSVAFLTVFSTTLSLSLIWLPSSSTSLQKFISYLRIQPLCMPSVSVSFTVSSVCSFLIFRTLSLFAPP